MPFKKLIIATLILSFAPCYSMDNKFEEEKKEIQNFFNSIDYDNSMEQLQSKIILGEQIKIELALRKIKKTDSHIILTQEAINENNKITNYISNFLSSHSNLEESHKKNLEEMIKHMKKGNQFLLNALQSDTDE